MRYLSLAATLVAAATIAPAADAQTGLIGQLLGRVMRPAATAASPQAASRATAAVMATPTAAQLAAIRQKLAAAAPTPTIAQDLTAATVVEPTVVAFACATDAVALRTLNTRRLTPRNYGTLDDNLNTTAMGGMRYHDRSTCVDLARVAAVTKPALNELAITLNFVSTTSGEARVQTFSFRKVGGQWLIDQLAPGEI